ncbi:hypothetical protein [Verminephrobacter eiseniae]|uniref:hypothetical protein n=1 Tax=Verminephrobacter eiseniae TaxID=364317 RepID=UPI00223838B1|nr:hypothetical protein [Verminephrobacter eiseniae]
MKANALGASAGEEMAGLWRTIRRMTVCQLPLRKLLSAREPQAPASKARFDAGFGRQEERHGGDRDHGVMRWGLKGSPEECAGPATACGEDCRARAGRSIQRKVKSTT